jgi:hypothetical protein
MMMTLNPFEKKFITTVLTAVKKNKQPAHTPGGPGRLRSWSGPVETDFQGRLRFSYANRPGNQLKRIPLGHLGVTPSGTGGARVRHTCLRSVKGV